MAFLKSDRGGLTVEFVAVIGPFLLLSFFVMETLVMLDWIGTAEKAAQLGARLAVVSNPVVTGLPATNALSTTNASAFYGGFCSANNCAPWATSPMTCTGGTGCNSDFDAIVNRMVAISPLLKQGCAQATPGCHITISYARDSQLGFAGGPTIPDVTVTISGVPYGAVVTTIIDGFLCFRRPLPCNSGLTVLPNVTVTLTGEDLSSVGS